MNIAGGLIAVGGVIGALIVLGIYATLMENWPGETIAISALIFILFVAFMAGATL